MSLCLRSFCVMMCFMCGATAAHARSGQFAAYGLYTYDKQSGNTFTLTHFGGGGRIQFRAGPENVFIAGLGVNYLLKQKKTSILFESRRQVTSIYSAVGTDLKIDNEIRFHVIGGVSFNLINEYTSVIGFTTSGTSKKIGLCAMGGLTIALSRSVAALLEGHFDYIYTSAKTTLYGAHLGLVFTF